MSISIKEFEKLKKAQKNAEDYIEEYKKQELRGIKSRLKDLGFNTIEEAEKELVALENSIEEEELELQKKLEELEIADQTTNSRS